MFTWGHKIVDYVLTGVARLRSQELFTLAILALVFLIAVGSAMIFGSSIALGAFIAGMIVGKTNVKHQAAANALPLKDIFAVIFFLSVGMLFNPMAIATHFTLFLGIISVILIVKPLVAYLVTILLGYSLNIALTMAIALAQIGEFSFILAEEAMNLNLLPDEGFDILVACALISISLNPLLFQMIGTFESAIQKFRFSKNPKTRSPKMTEKQMLASKVLVIGFGPIGREVSKIVKNSGYTPIIIEQNIDTVSDVKEHFNILFGDASEENILKEAHIEEAGHLLITIADTAKTVKIIHAARNANPRIQILARIQYISEKPLLEELKVKHICTETEALAAFSSLTHELFGPIAVF